MQPAVVLCIVQCGKSCFVYWETQQGFLICIVQCRLHLFCAFSMVIISVHCVLLHCCLMTSHRTAEQCDGAPAFSVKSAPTQWQRSGHETPPSSPPPPTSLPPGPPQGSPVTVWLGSSPTAPLTACSSSGLEKASSPPLPRPLERQLLPPPEPGTADATSKVTVRRPQQRRQPSQPHTTTL